MMILEEKAVQFGIGLPAQSRYTHDRSVCLSVRQNRPQASAFFASLASYVLQAGLCPASTSSWPPLCACRRQGMAADAAPALA